MSNLAKNISATTGKVKRKRSQWVEWPAVLIVALCAGSAVAVLIRGPELLRWACALWDINP